MKNHANQNGNQRFDQIIIIITFFCVHDYFAIKLKILGTLYLLNVNDSYKLNCYLTTHQGPVVSSPFSLNGG